MPWPTVFQRPQHRAVKVCAECRQDWPCESELERIAMNERITELAKVSFGKHHTY